MRETDYAYCVARIRANEAKLLSDEFLNKLADAKSHSDAVRMLAEKRWIISGEEIKEAAARHTHELWQLLSESLPDKNDLEILCLINNFQNIKAALKCFLTGEDATGFFLHPTTLDTDKLIDSVKSLDFDKLGSSYSESIKRAYNATTKTESGQLSEIIIDKAALSMLYKISVNNKNRIFSDVCSFITDASNIKIAFRCALTDKDEAFIDEAISECCYIDRKSLIRCSSESKSKLLEYLSGTVYSEGAKIYSENPTLFDKWFDEEIIRRITDAKYTAFGFSPVCSYYYKKLTEIKCVRIILSAKLAGADTATVRERVRTLNV